jgi:hypothetical protein
MKIKFLYVDKDGKVALTRKELDEIMKECYDNGYEDARAIYDSSKSLTITTPYYDYSRYGDSITCNTTVSGKVATCDSNCINSIEGALANSEALTSICEAFTTETVIG